MPTHPVIRSLHDLGLAAWTGGSLMGAVGLNAAASSLDDPRQRSRAATAGWCRWAPVNAAAIGAHLVGATGLLITDWPRVRSQQGVARSSAIKTATTGVGVGVAVWSGALNRKMVQAGAVPVAGATEAAPGTPPDVARTLRQLKLVQWLNPAVGLGLIALSDWQSQQQRASEVAKGRAQRLLSARPAPGPVLGLAAAGSLALLAARRRRTAAQPGPQPQPAQVTTDGAPNKAPGAAAPSGKQPGQGRTRQGAAGRPRLGRRAVVEPLTAAVTVSHDEAVVQHQPVTDANRAQALDGPEMTEAVHEVTLHADKPVGIKPTAPVEPVEPGTQPATKQQQDIPARRAQHPDPRPQ
jgi:hypothetical protein